MVIPKIYTLPEVSFIGGATQEFIFNCYSSDTNDEYDVSGCSANFSVIQYINKTGDPIISKSMTMSGNVVSVTLDADETIDLYGKYIYQISITNTDGAIDIPGQGILHIANNINKNYV